MAESVAAPDACPGPILDHPDSSSRHVRRARRRSTRSPREPSRPVAGRGRTTRCSTFLPVRSLPASLPAEVRGHPESGMEAAPCTVSSGTFRKTRTLGRRRGGSAPAGLGDAGRRPARRGAAPDRKRDQGPGSLRETRAPDPCRTTRSRAVAGGLWPSAGVVVIGAIPPVCKGGLRRSVPVRRQERRGSSLPMDGSCLDADDGHGPRAARGRGGRIPGLRRHRVFFALSGDESGWLGEFLRLPEGPKRGARRRVDSAARDHLRANVRSLASQRRRDAMLFEAPLFHWTGQGETVLIPWTQTSLGRRTSGIVLPHDASPPVQVAGRRPAG